MMCQTFSAGDRSGLEAGQLVYEATLVLCADSALSAAGKNNYRSLKERRMVASVTPKLQCMLLNK